MIVAQEWYPLCRHHSLVSRNPSPLLFAFTGSLAPGSLIIGPLTTFCTQETALGEPSSALVPCGLPVLAALVARSLGSLLTLDNPPYLILFPWPLYLVLPVLCILNKPV